MSQPSRCESGTAIVPHQAWMKKIRPGRISRCLPRQVLTRPFFSDYRLLFVEL